MMLAFPSPCWPFVADRDIAKGMQVSPKNWGTVVVCMAPIDIKQHDSLIINVRTCQIEIIARDGFAVYRAGWKN